MYVASWSLHVVCVRHEEGLPNKYRILFGICHSDGGFCNAARQAVENILEMIKLLLDYRCCKVILDAGENYKKTL